MPNPPTNDTGGLLANLVRTKLLPPSPDPRAIRRETLAAHPVENWRLITAVIAPAGSGKSTLMAQMAATFAATQAPFCWLSLDAEDNDPATFAIYLISALDRVQPGFAREELIALEANPIRDFDALFGRLLARIAALKMPFAIFLDDFQHLDDKHILHFLDRVLVRPPSGLHLLIASRALLPLQLARLRVANQLREIGPEDLNFNRDQAGQFLKLYHGLNLAPPELDALHESMEGWPAGVQLVGLALHQHRGSLQDLIHALPSRDRDLTRYLVENVLGSQSENVRHFLLHSAPLRRMCADLCQVVTGQADAEACLHYLGQANLFLIPLDSQGLWFRYHHLFSDFLRAECRRTDPEAYRDACRRAAEWCENHGEPTEAIRYALDAGNHRVAATTIARHAPRTSMYRGDHYTVLGWLRRLPAGYHDQHPEILLAHAWSLAFSRDTPKALTLAQRTLDLLAEGHWELAPAQQDRLVLLARNTQAATLACADAIDDCLERADALRGKVSEDNPFVIATLSNCLGYGYFVKRDFSRSRSAAVDAHQYGHQADAAYLSAWGDFLHGLADVELGQLQEARNLCRSVTRDSQSLALGQKSYVAGLAALLDTEIAIQRCDFARAEKSITRGAMFKEIFGPVEPQLIATRCEARLAAHRGQLNEARTILQEGQDDGLRAHYPRLSLTLAVEEASLQLGAGDLAGATETARRWQLRKSSVPPQNRERPFRGLDNTLRLLEARFLLAEKQPGKALRILTQLKQAPHAETGGGFFIAVLTCRALAHWACGKHRDAARQLDAALEAAATEFHAWPLTVAGDALLPILETIIELRSETPDMVPKMHARLALQNWLLASLRGDPAPSPASTATARSAASDATSQPLGEELTSREVQLLQLLAAGLSNRRLAEAVLLSESTVKWHLHNIYTKLDVSSRGQAVARARQTGVL